MSLSNPLKVLILEENQSEIKLFESILKDSNIDFESKSAKTESDFIKYINRFKPDIILAGTNLTKYSVHEALAFLKEQGHLIPFILITGTIPEELAKDYLKYGVDEYLTKYNLLSLPAVITKSIGIKNTIKEKKESEELNKENEAKLQTFFNNNPESIFEIGFNHEFININNAAQELLEISDSKLISKKIKILDFIDPSKLKEFKEVHANACRGHKRNISLQIKRAKNNDLWLDCKLLPLFDSNQTVSSILIIGINVTEKEKVKTELSKTKGNYESLVASIDEALWSVDRNYRIVEFNEVASKMFNKLRGINVRVNMPLKEFATIPERYEMWIERYNRSLGGEKFTVEDIFDTENGKFHAQITLYPIFANDEIVGVSILGRDVTAFKKAEEELKQSEQIFRTLSENAPVGIFKLDKAGNCIYANDFIPKLLRTSPGKIKDRDWIDFIYKEDLNNFIAKFENFLILENSIETKIRFSDKDGRIIWTKICVSFIENESEKIAIGTITNISKLKKAYDELLEKQTIIDAVENNSKIGFWIRDFRNDREALWSDAIYKIFDQEKSKGPMSRTEINDIIHPDDRDNFKRSIESVQNGHYMNIEYRIQLRSGITKAVLVSAYPIYDSQHKVIKMSGTILDLTDIYTRERELKSQKRLMSNAFEIANIGLWEHNVKDRTTSWSKETKRMFGLKEIYPPLSLEVQAAIMHPDDRQGFLDFYNAQVISGKSTSYEYRVYVHGALRTHQIYSYPFLSKDHEVERLTGIIIDKTSTRKTEEKLVASENLFNSFFENVPDAIFIEDNYGTILNVNKKACELQGISKKQLIGKNISELIPEADKSKLMADFKKLFNGEITEHISTYYKITGEPADIEIKAMRISYKDVPAVLLNVREV